MSALIRPQIAREVVHIARQTVFLTSRNYIGYLQDICLFPRQPKNNEPAGPTLVINSIRTFIRSRLPTRVLWCIHHFQMCAQDALGSLSKETEQLFTAGCPMTSRAFLDKLGNFGHQLGRSWYARNAKK